MKKLLAVLLTCMLMLSVLPMGLFSITAGAVTNDEYIEIYTVEDLYCVRYDLEANYILMNDINLTGVTATGGDWDFMGNGWNPIGSDDVYGDGGVFSGVFDGNGHSITGMRINVTTLPAGSGELHLGLFAKISGAVRNLELSGGVFCLQNRAIKAGAIAGETLPGAVIENVNCAVVVDVGFTSVLYSSTDKCIYAGGIVGYNAGDISVSTHTSSVKGNGSRYHDNTYSNSYHRPYVGGICGYNSGSVSQCMNKGNVFVDYVTIYNSRMDVYAGGLVGYGNSASATIENSYNTGEVSSSENRSSTYVGGILGYGQQTVTNCYNIGTAVDYGIGPGTNSNCYYLNGTGANTVGATPLTVAQFKLYRVFKGFDFDTVWTMGGDPDYEYPELQCFTLKGEVGIKGEAKYPATLEADLSKVDRVDDSFTYEWLADGECVGTESTYTVQESDIGKTLQLKVTGNKISNKGVLASEEVTVKSDSYMVKEASVRHEGVDENGNYQSAGIRFKSRISSEFRKSATELGFVAIPTAVLNGMTVEEYMFNDGSLALSTKVKAEGMEELIYAVRTDANGQKYYDYQMMIKGLTREGVDRNLLDTEITVAMYAIVDGETVYTDTLSYSYNWFVAQTAK